MLRLKVEFRDSDYDVFDNAILIPRQLTEREAAVLLSCLSLTFYRGVWGNISDADWDALNGELAVISGKLQT